MNPSSPATDPKSASAGSSTAGTFTSSPAALLSSSPDAESVRAARTELIIAASAVGVFATVLSCVVGIRVFHMAAATDIGVAFSALVAVLFALAILLGMALLVRMHSRGNFLGEQLRVLNAVVQETHDLGDNLRQAAQQDLEASALLEENTRAVLTDAEEIYAREFHTHLSGLQAAGQVLGLEQLPPPAKVDIVSMSQPLRDDVGPRLSSAKMRRQEIRSRLEAVVLTHPTAPASPHSHVHAPYPGRPDIGWIDPSVLPDGFISASTKRR